LKREKVDPKELIESIF